MSFSFEDHGQPAGEWNSNTFPYNLSTFTASSNVHPDLPSEPPGYDEFEFSLPSELSPSLFSLPFMSGEGNDMLSPTALSFPALSSRGASPPSFWRPSDFHAQHSFTSQHERRDSAATVTKNKLFEDEERNALDAFFNQTLDDPAKPSDPHRNQAQASSIAGPSPKASTSTSKSQTKAKALKASVTESRSKPAIASQLSTAKRKASAASSAKTSGQASKAALKGPSHFEAVVHMKTEDDADEVPGLAPNHEELIKPGPSKKGKFDNMAADDDGSEDNKTGMTHFMANGTAKRDLHVPSEQKRRSSIKDNYKSLVDLLLAGEPTSGISLLNGAGGGIDDEEALDGMGDGSNGKAPTGKKGKPKGRGRGRKGQDGAGATKSVVLERAADYLRWLERGNSELDKEISRIEGLLAT